MRIAHVTSALGHEGAGLRMVVEALSAEQLRSGHTVHVFGLESPGWRAGDAKTWAGAPATAFPVTGPNALGYAPALTPALIEFSPDVIHLHGLWTWPSISVLRASCLRGVGRVVSPHGMLDTWAMAQSSLRKRLALALFERVNLNGSTIHALCESEAESIRALGFRAPVEIIPNGVEVPNLAVAPAVPPPWAGHIPETSRVMLFLGRVHPKKGLAILIDAMIAQRAALETGDWHLAVIGWDQVGQRAELEQKLSGTDVAARVHFLGPAFGEAKSAALRKADLFVLPSLSEGLPMSVLEAWGHGLPVLFTPQCNLPEGPAAGAAWEAEPVSEAMASCLREILVLSPEARASVGRAGARLVEQTFTWAKVAEQFDALYRHSAATTKKVPRWACLAGAKG